MLKHVFTGLCVSGLLTLAACTSEKAPEKPMQPTEQPSAPVQDADADENGSVEEHYRHHHHEDEGNEK